MTTAIEVLRDAFTRVHDDLPDLLDGLSGPELVWRPDAQANPIGWLVWHLTRVQDDHVAGVADALRLADALGLAGVEPAGGVRSGRLWSGQLWTAQGWSERFGLPYAVGEIGYGHSSEQVGAFRVAGPDLLVGYHDAVHRLTLAVLAALSDGDLDRVVDERWDPPVTAAVRLVSVVNDITQHLGQAAYVAGMTRRLRR